MQEQLVRRYQRLLRELTAAPTQRRPVADGRPISGAQVRRPKMTSRRPSDHPASPRGKLRDLAQSQHD